MTQNEFNQISILVENLFNVIEIEGEYWLTMEFEPAENSKGMIGSILYHSFKGICITDFIKQKKIDLQDKPTKLAYLQQINTYIEQKSYIKVKFSKYARFFFYTKN